MNVPQLRFRPVSAFANSEFVSVRKKPDMSEKFSSTGYEVATGTPDHFASLVKVEMATMGKVIRKAGIHGE